MDEVLHRLSKLFQALANGVRLQMLVKLRDGEHTVSELSDHVERSINAVSHHLRTLRDNNLVVTRTEGRNRIYWLKRPGLVKACLALTKFLERNES